MLNYILQFLWIKYNIIVLIEICDFYYGNLLVPFLLYFIYCIISNHIISYIILLYHIISLYRLYYIKYHYFIWYINIIISTFIIFIIVINGNLLLLFILTKIILCNTCNCYSFTLCFFGKIPDFLTYFFLFIFKTLKFEKKL